MARSAELQELCKQFMEAMLKGDTAWLERVCSSDDGITMIGTDPKEWYEGQSAARRALRIWARDMGLSRIRLADSNVKAYSEGDHGWASCHPKYIMPDGTELRSRMTIVFHRQGGEWKIVQLHGSLGVANQDTAGLEGMEIP